MAEKKKEIVVSGNVGDQVIERVEALNKVGFTMPEGYSYVNAIKASLLVLQELKDKDKKPALEVCTPNSVATALFEMATKGLDASKKTCYFLVRNDKLCMHESYFGKALQVKRIYPSFDPHPVVIHEGDEFIYEIDKETGCKRIVKHEQKLENLDKDFVGGYMYIPTANGGQDLFIMTKKQILTAWSKSSSIKQTVHNEFKEKMVCKTIVNSGCNMVINSTPELSAISNNEDNNENTHNNKSENITFHDSEEFQEAEVVEDIQETKAIEANSVEEPEF